MGNCRSKEECPSETSEPRVKKKFIPEGLRTFNYPLNTATKASTSNQQYNVNVINSTRAEVNLFLLMIHEFHGTNELDKNYRYLDEMLTRCILKLDKIDCHNLADRNYRKEAIRDINQALTILDRKLKINADVAKLQSDLN